MCKVSSPKNTLRIIIIIKLFPSSPHGQPNLERLFLVVYNDSWHRRLKDLIHEHQSQEHSKAIPGIVYLVAYPVF